MYYLLLSALLSASHALSIIKTVQPSCIVDTDKGTLDLSPLAEDSKPSFSCPLTSSLGKGTLYWNPCNNVAESTCTSTGELLAVTTDSVKLNNLCTVLGTRNISQFTVFGDYLALLYVSNSGPFFVLFECSKTSQVNTLSLPANQARLNAKFEGPGACFSHPGSSTSSPPAHGGKLSIGSILSISFGLMVIIYLLVGFTYMKLIKRADGFDQLPNRRFWTSLPSYTKSGVLFVVKCGKITPTNDYEKI